MVPQSLQGEHPRPEFSQRGEYGRASGTAATINVYVASYTTY